MAARLRIALVATCAVFAAATALAQFYLYSDSELLAEGERAYSARNCLSASRFLFAYQQRNPVELQGNAALQADLVKALNACARRVAVAGVDAKAESGSVGAALPEVVLPAVRLQAQPIASAAPGRCDIYALIAIAQQRANLSQRCGLQDNRWQPDYRYHYDWCVQVPAATSRAGTAERQRLLDLCRP